MSFLDDWKEWSNAKKAISIIIVCCIGIIIIGLIVGSTSPDKNTTPKSTISVSDLAISSAGYGGYDVHANQTIKANGHAYISGGNSPAKAKVLFFDSSLSTEESDAIYTQEVTM